MCASIDTSNVVSVSDGPWRSAGEAGREPGLVELGRAGRTGRAELGRSGGAGQGERRNAPVPTSHALIDTRDVARCTRMIWRTDTSTLHASNDTRNVASISEIAEHRESAPPRHRDRGRPGQGRKRPSSTSRQNRRLRTYAAGPAGKPRNSW